MNSVATGLVLIPGPWPCWCCSSSPTCTSRTGTAIFAPGNWPGPRTRLHYGSRLLDYFHGPSALLFLLSSLLLVAMAICIFVSTRLMKEPFQLKWYDVALMVVGVLLAYFSLRAHMASWRIQREGTAAAEISAAGSWAGGVAAVWLLSLLPLCISQEFGSFPHAGILAGAMGSADGRRPIPPVLS